MDSLRWESQRCWLSLVNILNIGQETPKRWYPHVCHEEDHDDDGVPVSHGEPEVLLHAGDHSQPEIRAVDERDGVHDAENRE